MKIGVNETLSTNIEDLPGEIWEDVPGTNERYQISNYSRVKSLIKDRPIILKKFIANGRFTVLLTAKYGAKRYEKCGRLVAKVFLRAPEENEVIKHKDGNILNDSLDNLKWITKKESALNAVRAGRFPESHGRSNKNGMTIICAKDVIEIRRLKANGNTYNQLSKQFNISKGGIQNIVERRTWKTIN